VATKLPTNTALPPNVVGAAAANSTEVRDAAPLAEPGARLVRINKDDPPAEEVFFVYEDIQVSSKDFTVGQKAVPIAKIRAIDPKYLPPSRVLPVGLLCVGVGLLFTSVAVIGVFACIAAGGWLICQIGSFRLVMTTEYADEEVVLAARKERVDKVVAAVRSAVESRKAAERRAHAESSQHLEVLKNESRTG
jgi:hypothetical protein